MTSTFVLDASAVLALGYREEGADLVAERLEGSSISTVNWSEVLRKASIEGIGGSELRDVLRDASVTLVPFVEADADATAALWPNTRRLGLSLADRACLALAARLDVPAVTADRAWVDLQTGIEIVCIR